RRLTNALTVVRQWSNLTSDEFTQPATGRPGARRTRPQPGRLRRNGPSRREEQRRARHRAPGDHRRPLLGPHLLPVAGPTRGEGIVSVPLGPAICPSCHTPARIFVRRGGELVCNRCASTLVQRRSESPSSSVRGAGAVVDGAGVSPAGREVGRDGLASAPTTRGAA